MSENIQHYGILGMRWGIRRQRGPDGRVTNKVLSKTDEARIRTEQRGESQPQVDPIQSLRNIPMSKMTNEQMRAVNERLNLERQYRELRASEIKKGESFVGSVLKTSGKAALTTLTTATILYAGKRTIAAVAGEDIVGKMFTGKKK